MFGRKEDGEQIEGQTTVDEQIDAAGEPPADLDAEAIDQLSDEEAAGLAASLGQVAIPMMQVPLDGVRVSVVPGQDGAKAIFVGPIGFTFVLPLDAEGAKVVTQGLTGGIEIAREMPKLVTP